MQNSTSKERLGLAPPSQKATRLLDFPEIPAGTAPEEPVLQSEQKFRQLTESMKDAFVSMDLSGRIQDFNSVYQALLGYPEEELRRLTCPDLTPERWRSFDAHIVREQVLQHGSSEVYVKEYRRKDGTVFPVESRTFLIRDQCGHPAAMWAVVRDLSEQNQKEQALVTASAEIQKLKSQLLEQSDCDCLEGEIQLHQLHPEIIGRSRAIMAVLRLIEQVAPTGAAVLLSGETGTGKELLARAVHRLSPRAALPMVEVNCAALPEALVESELFGRERGAYTGALTSHMGRFEAADGSTILLDEVGDLPLQVQAKLLRVLQEGRFQRLGDTKDHRVNVRVIAATNRNLSAAVRQGHFREDLYYRLNVFPVKVPPLRERMEDISMLVLAFLQEFCSRMGKQMLKVPRRVMEEFEHYDWPGNVRELRNIIERGVILSTGDTMPLAWLRERETSDHEPLTLAETEKLHILKILERTGGRIKGPLGAAEILGLNPGTLYSRMRKLQILAHRERVGISKAS